MTKRSNRPQSALLISEQTPRRQFKVHATAQKYEHLQSHIHLTCSPHACPIVTSRSPSSPFPEVNWSKIYQLPLFGVQVPGTKINFKWTAQKDFEQMNLRAMIKLRKIILTGSALDGICGIQLYFTDNIISPLFESNRKRPTQHLYIDQKKKVTIIEARVAYD